MQPTESSAPQQGQMQGPPQQVAAAAMPQFAAGQPMPMQQPVANPANAPVNANKPNSTQASLQITEIRDNMVIMKDGSFRAVLACQSINFDLMSGREKEAVEYSYQNFLNSLYFPIQILVRSQRVDIGPYIDKLITIRQQQDNMLLGVLMDDYINFIDILSQEANIMDKDFYIVVPFYPTGDLNDLKEQAGGFFKKIFNNKASAGPITIDKMSFEKAKEEIRNRSSSVSSGLFQMGVRSKQLDTNELARLYYNVYNPETATHQPLVDFNDMATTFVRKGDSSVQTPQGGVQ